MYKKLFDIIIMMTRNQKGDEINKFKLKDENYVVLFNSIK